MAIKPLGNRVLVKPKEAIKVSKGGIILSDNAQKKPIEGNVLAVGRGRIDNGVLIKSELKIGDKVLYGEYSGNKYLTENNEEFLIINEEEILAIIE